MLLRTLLLNTFSEVFRCGRAYERDLRTWSLNDQAEKVSGAAGSAGESNQAGWEMISASGSGILRARPLGQPRLSLLNPTMCAR